MVQANTSSASLAPKNGFVQILITLGAILMWYTFSIGLTFYNKWLFGGGHFRFPISVTTCHMFSNFLICWILRLLLEKFQKKKRTVVPMNIYLTAVVPTAAAGALDIALSNASLLFITISLYTMCKSTTIMFLLTFSICFGLEKPRWNTFIVILSIALGIFLFTFGDTAFNLIGFLMVMTATVLAGLRWALTQLLLQKKDIGLHNPIDTLYHVTPTMSLSLLPIALYFEGISFFTSDLMFNGTPDVFLNTLAKIGGGAILAFMMNWSEFLLLSLTSGLTLSIAGIVKEIFTVSLSVIILGDSLKPINIVGMLVSVAGIFFYNVLKYRLLYGENATEESGHNADYMHVQESDSQFDLDLDDDEDYFFSNESLHPNEELEMMAMTHS